MWWALHSRKRVRLLQLTIIALSRLMEKLFKWTLNCYSSVSWQLQVVWLKPKLKYSNRNYAVSHQHYSNHQDS